MNLLTTQIIHKEMTVKVIIGLIFLICFNSCKQLENDEKFLNVIIEKK